VAERQLKLSIKLAPFGDAAQKDAKKVTDELKRTDAAVAKFKTTTDKMAKASDTTWSRMRSGVESVGRAFSAATHSLGGFASGVDNLNRRVASAFGKIANLRNIILGSVAGGLAYKGVSSIFEQGNQQLNALRKARREFGADAEGLIDRGNSVGFRAGLGGDDALTGLIPIARAVSTTEAGRFYRGKKLTEAQAAALRKQTLSKGSQLFERLATLAPDLDPETIGRVLADAGSGNEGIRRLVSTFGLSRRSARLAEANEKGKAFGEMTAAERKQFDVKAGKKLGQGDLVDLLLQRSGLTDKAAEDERKKFSFQMHSIKAQFMDVLGDIGAEALEKVNGGFAKGATLAEKFKAVLESPKGKETVEKLGNAIGSMVEGLIKLATELPKVVGFLDKHKTLLLSIGGAYAGLSVVGRVRNTFSNALGGAGDVAGKLLGASGKPIPVYVVNAPGGGVGGPNGGSGGGKLGKALGVLGVGAAAYELTTLADEKFGISDSIANLMANATGADKKDNAAILAGTQRHQAELAALAAAKRSRVSELEAGGMAHGKALAQAQSEFDGLKIDIQNVTFGTSDSVQAMAVKLAEPIARELERRRRNATANGAAP
jgi:hypothetical protein